MEKLDQEYIRSLQIHDPDHYFSTFFAPRAQRNALLTLYAFNSDLERIPDSVSEPMLGEIRLQWWRDVIENADKQQKTGNPLADQLIRLISDYNLPVIRLQELIDARSFELSGDPMPDIQSLRNYIKKTEEALCLLSCRLLDNEISANSVALVRQSAFIYKVAILLARASADKNKDRQYIPDDIREEVISFLKTEYADFKSASEDLPPKFSPAFLPVTLTEAYIKKATGINKADADSNMQINPAYRLWKYWKTQAFGY